MTKEIMMKQSWQERIQCSIFRHYVCMSRAVAGCGLGEQIDDETSDKWHRKWESTMVYEDFYYCLPHGACG